MIVERCDPLLAITFPVIVELAARDCCLPMVKNDSLVGVLDLDSHLVADYDEIDREYLENFG